ncbi:ribonuclease domain-containing protein [Deinococcus alpinitundrae]|uniref:ribonuclease domain-containing protein n=1 Tax=Deinococcus alpinitundrae TaxID=468913 RepID=UPI00137AACFF|nr:ribonuclease domain-containing protein [Deinococcus alpinitundrae]
MSARLLPLGLALLLVACSPPAKSGTATQAQTTQSTSTTSPKSSARPRASTPAGGLPTIARADLPPEGQRTLRLIVSGGPSSSSRDGVVFGNRERLLPIKPSGTYHEYTVPTPGASDRGARRIVCGPPLRSAAGCYYTADHYASFKKIAP